VKIDVTLSAPVERTARVLQLAGLFDVPIAARSECRIAAEVPAAGDDWRIGLVVGPSGSGKSSLARLAFPDAPVVTPWGGFDWPGDRAVVDGFAAELTIKDVTRALSSVGFSSPPSWLRPFRLLSTGEQFRATVARALLDPSPVIVIDEFTSVVDRQVAQVGSAAVAKAIRASSAAKRIVCVTCHYDVEPWLTPDWVVEMPAGTLTRGSLQRPGIPLEIRRSSGHIWPLFAPHHYLATNLARGAVCFLALVDGRPAAFCAVLSFPHPKKPAWREHRCVCLPDFQGVGIGNTLSAYVASLFRGLRGKAYFSATGNPAMIAHRLRSPLWRLGRAPSLNRKNKPTAHKAVGIGKTLATNRLTTSFEYVGPSRPDDAKGFGLK
jgi:energy-coupling factor transporter ATP-binding protein EcfA2